MSLSNKEMQLHKTCQLYSYVLTSQGKDVPEAIQECASSYDQEYLVDCVEELARSLRGLDSETFEKIVNDTHSLQARHLAQWWEMYQTYIPIQ